MKTITMTNVAKEAGVSRQTVSEVLNKKNTFASQKTKDRVFEIARKLNYTPNHFAQSLRTGKTNTIGITSLGRIHGNFDDPYASLVYMGLSEPLTNSNYKMTFHHFNKNDSETPYLELLESRSVDGLVLLLFSRDIKYYDILAKAKLNQLNMPTVMIHSLDRIFDHGHNVGLKCKVGGKAAADHFIQHGYNSIGMIYPGNPNPHIQDLIGGFKNKMTSSDVEIKNENIHNLRTTNAQEGYDLAGSLISKGGGFARAYFVINDYVANGMMQRFSEAGIKVPEDIALIGFGDVQWPKGLVNNLTTVKQMAYNKGKEAGNLLLDTIKKKSAEIEYKSKILIPELTIRKSCGCSFSPKEI